MICKTLLFALAAAASVNAGGKTLSPQESQPIFQLFQRLCANQNQNSFDSQADKSMFVYCKIWNGNQVPTKEVNHNAEISATNQNKQVIFVQPPSARYIHNVSVSGNQNQQQQEVYVLPSQANHEYRVQSPDIKIDSVKPSLYFLSDGQDQSGNNQRPISPPADAGTGSVSVPILPGGAQTLPGNAADVSINSFQRPSSSFSGTRKPSNGVKQTSGTSGGYSSPPQVGLHSRRNAPEVLYLKR